MEGMQDTTGFDPILKRLQEFKKKKKPKRGKGEEKSERFHDREMNEASVTA